LEPFIPHTSATAGASKADEEFVQEARILAHLTRSIIQAAEQALKQKHQTPDPTVAGAGDAAISAVDATANEIGVSSAGGYDGAIPSPSILAISIKT
jgi:hypothetical protein